MRKSPRTSGRLRSSLGSRTVPFATTLRYTPAASRPSTRWLRRSRLSLAPAGTPRSPWTLAGYTLTGRRAARARKVTAKRRTTRLGRQPAARSKQACRLRRQRPAATSPPRQGSATAQHRCACCRCPPIITTKMTSRPCDSSCFATLRHNQGIGGCASTREQRSQPAHRRMRRHIEHDRRHTSCPSRRPQVNFYHTTARRRFLTQRAVSAHLASTSRLRT